MLQTSGTPGGTHAQGALLAQSGSAQSTNKSQSSSVSLKQFSCFDWQTQTGSFEHDGSSQSMRPSQSSSKPLPHLPASVGEQPHAGVPAQSASKQSTAPSQSSSLLLVQFSPLGLGTQPQLGTFTHAGSKQSLTPLQSLSEPSPHTSG